MHGAHKTHDVLMPDSYLLEFMLTFSTSLITTGNIAITSLHDHEYTQ
jgi:hypothetical protein